MTEVQPNNPPNTTIEIVNLYYQYPDGTIALRELSLNISDGEIVCLAGPNGAGKSTLLLALSGLIKIRGTVRVCGEKPDVNYLFGLVFQDANDQLFCSSVYEDVAFGPRNQQLNETEVAERVSNALQLTGMSGYDNRNAHHLSGGEKKRVAIAAIFACNPSVLALDEPWANLDARGVRAVSNIINSFQGTRIIATQNLYNAAEVCERLIIIDDGNVIADDKMRELLSDKSLLEKHGLEFGHHCRFCEK